MFNQLLMKTRTIYDLIENVDRIYGQSDALYVSKGEEDITETYKTFSNKVRMIANYVSKMYGKKKKVILLGEFNEEWLYVFMGLLYAGNIVIPMDINLKKQELISNARKIGVDVILEGTAVDRMLVNSISEAIKTVRSGAIFDVYTQAVKESFNDNITYIGDIPKLDDIALLIFTSGTTGSNKIVQITHKNICADCILCTDILEDEFNPGDRILPVLPMHHLFAVTANLILSIFYGMTICIGGGLKTLSNDLQKFKPELLMVVPLIAEGLNKRIEKVLGKLGYTTELSEEQKKRINCILGGNLKAMICGGAPLNSELIKKFQNMGISLRNGYGITECSPVIVCNTKRRNKLNSVGKVNTKRDCCEVQIIDGEICVRGDIVSPGYYNDVKANDIAYVNGWFKTGDIGCIDEDGYLFITGRKKNIVILPDGNNFFLDELEEKIKMSPLVDAVVIVCKTVKEQIGLEALIHLDDSYMQTNSNYVEEIDTVIRKINEQNPRYKRIASFKIVEEDFERTSLGKVKKFKYESN